VCPQARAAPTLASDEVGAKSNGVTKNEVVEIITHMAFYAGWPNAVNAITVAKEVFKNVRPVS
jgi:4-carboxymuconolactone decarboxylase